MPFTNVCRNQTLNEQSVIQNKINKWHAIGQINNDTNSFSSALAVFTKGTENEWSDVK